MNSLVSLLLLATLGSVAGLIGGVVFLIKKDWAKRLSVFAVPFAAGVLLSVSILHLIPEASHVIGEKAYLIVLLSLVGSFLFEEYFAHLHHHEGRVRTSFKAAIPLVIFGDTIHNFIDGVAIASAYLISPSFGLVVALATFLHETPHEIGDFGILLAAGWKRSKVFVANLFSALATFPGALSVYYFMSDAHDKIGVLLAVSAGVFLYLGASDFLPEVSEEKQKDLARKKVLFVILGVIAMYLLGFILPEH